METIIVKSFDDFAKHLLDVYDNNCFEEDNNRYEEVKTVGVIAKYEEAKYIITSLIQCGLDVGTIELLDKFYYDKEYIIYISDGEVFCDTAYDEKRGDYYSIIDNYVFVLDNCNSRVLHSVFDDSCEVVTVSFEEDSKEDNNYTCNCDSKDKEEKESVDYDDLFTSLENILKTQNILLGDILDEFL